MHVELTKSSGSHSSPSIIYLFINIKEKKLGYTITSLQINWKCLYLLLRIHYPLGIEYAPEKKKYAITTQQVSKIDPTINNPLTHFPKELLLYPATIRPIIKHTIILRHMIPKWSKYKLKKNESESA